MQLSVVAAVAENFAAPETAVPFPSYRAEPPSLIARAARKNSSRLLADAQTANDVQVALGIDFAEIVQQSTTATDHRQQTSPTCIVLAMCLHVLGKVVNPRRKNCDLDFGRSRIGVRVSKFLD